MPTPPHVFQEIAARHGLGSSEEQINQFYSEDLKQLPVSERQAVLDELLARDGEPQNKFDRKQQGAQRPKVLPPLPRMRGFSLVRHDALDDE